MAVKALARIVVLYLLYSYCYGQNFKIPDVTIEALRPKGIRIFMPDIPNTTLFVFQGNINKSIRETDVGKISAEVTDPTNGKWYYEDRNVQLKPGDVINYYVHVVNNGAGYIKDKQTFTVRELIDPSQTTSSNPPGPECKPTITFVKDGKACAGQTIFEDNFDILREDLWRVEQYVPDQPDYPFVSYQRPSTAPIVKVVDGNLIIEPKPQQELAGYSNFSIISGTLDLFSGCTATLAKCKYQAWGASILPPVASGQLSTKFFAFTYGVVEIRAKMPQGDWIYPDILLEPLMKKYGEANYASGAIRVAGALGNERLTTGSKELGNKVLYGGPIISMNCRKTLLRYKESNTAWGDDFHVYEIKWSPEGISLSVDGEQWGNIEPTANGLQGHFDPNCQLPRSVLSTGFRIAPFDDHFFITLGVAVGGITEFDDDLYSGQTPKPWKNRSRKANLHFWEDMGSWKPTWKQPALVVDYVRVRAL